VLVLDNLNTDDFSALYETFEPEEAWRIREKIEIHYTPKHGSWLNMVRRVGAYGISVKHGRERE